jgi:hypothetical protein
VPEYFDWATLLNVRRIASGPVGDVFTEENLRRTYGGRLAFLHDNPASPGGKPAQGAATGLAPQSVEVRHGLD